MSGPAAMTDRAVRARLRSVVYDACTGAGALDADRFDEDLWRHAIRSAMAPLVASVHPGGNAALPESIAASLDRAAMHHLRTVADLRGVAAALNAAGVRWLVFKGPVLADVVYRRRGLRLYGDLDILVHPHDLGRALEALLHDPVRLLDQNWSHIRATEQSELSIVLGFGTLLDLHWHVISNPRTRAAVGLDVARLFDDAVLVDIGSVQVHTLSPLDTVIYVCLHAALSGGHQLRWLVDIQQSVAWSRPDPRELVARAHALGCLLAVQVMMTRVATHLDPGLRPVVRNLGRRSLWRVLCAVVGRIVPLDPDADSYSGRAVFSSTRSTSLQSLRAGADMLRAVRAAGKDRRTGVVDASALHAVGGDEFDRAAWLELAAQHAS